MNDCITTKESLRAIGNRARIILASVLLVGAISLCGCQAKSSSPATPPDLYGTREFNPNSYTPTALPLTPITIKPPEPILLESTPRETALPESPAMPIATPNTITPTRDIPALLSESSTRQAELHDQFRVTVSAIIESGEQFPRINSDMSDDELEQIEPGLVLIDYYPRHPAGRYCTGFIAQIDPNYVYIVSAAHCATGDPFRLQLLTKQYNPWVDYSTEHEIYSFADDPSRGFADIAVIRVPNIDGFFVDSNALPWTSIPSENISPRYVIVGFPGTLTRGNTKKSGNPGIVVEQETVCTVTKGDDVITLNTVSTGAVTAGASGSPVFDDELVAVAVHSGHTYVCTCNGLEGFYEIYLPCSVAAVLPPNINLALLFP